MKKLLFAKEWSVTEFNVLKKSNQFLQMVNQKRALIRKNKGGKKTF